VVKHTKRILFLLAGLTAVALAVLGVFLPLLPTTPFLLLAAYCFSNSSVRLHGWLLNHRVFGQMIRDWEEHGVIRTKIKVLATTSMLVLVSYPLVFMEFAIAIKAVVVMSILCVNIFIWTRPGQY
jgi:uncharacterized membrane protein YbaN (DUF454 family)